MYLLLLGLGLALLKYLQIEPVAAWDWWWVLSPFGAAVLWWWGADLPASTTPQPCVRRDEPRPRRRDEGRRRLGLPPLDRR